MKSGFTGPAASLVADGKIESPPDTEKFPGCATVLDIEAQARKNFDRFDIR